MTNIKFIFALLLGLILAAVASGWQLSRRWYDPLFGLREFPVNEYQSDYSPMAEQDFQCRWQFLSENGKQDGVRMAVFKPGAATWPVAVALPEELTGELTLARGQVFAMKVTVAKNGLIYAKVCR